MRQYLIYLAKMLLYLPTDNPTIDRFVWHSSITLECLAVAGLLVLILRNETVRLARRPEDRRMRRFLSLCW